MKNNKSFLITVLGGTAFLTWFAVFHFPHIENVDVNKKHDSENSTTTESKQNTLDEVGVPGQPGGTALITPQQHHDEGEALVHDHHHDEMAVDLESLMKDSWNVREHWYDEPMLLDEESYMPKSIPLELGEHCLTNASLKSEKSFSEHIELHYGQDVTSRDATGTFFKSIAQFFQWEDKYWQINVIWDFDMPPIYRYEIFSSENPGFNENVSGEPSAVEFPKIADPISAQEWLDQMVAHYDGLGAEIGARIVEQRVTDEKGRAHEWTSLNGQLTTWQFGTGVCVLNASATSGRCACEKHGGKS